MSAEEERLRRALSRCARIAESNDPSRSASELLREIRETARATLAPSAMTKNQQRPWGNDPRLVLSVRAMNIIHRAFMERAPGIRLNSMGKLDAERVATLTEGELRRINGCGEVTIAEIRAALQAIKLDLAEEPPLRPSGPPPNGLLLTVNGQELLRSVLDSEIARITQTATRKNETDAKS